MPPDGFCGGAAYYAGGKFFAGTKPVETQLVGGSDAKQGAASGHPWNIGHSQGKTLKRRDFPPELGVARFLQR